MVFFADDGVRSCHKLVIAGPDSGNPWSLSVKWKRIMDARVNPAHDL